MFDARSALMSLNGKALDSVDLRSKLEEICRAHLKEIPADFRARDLFEVAERKQWLRRESGRFRIQVD
jgi:hypothetical protein